MENRTNEIRRPSLLQVAAEVSNCARNLKALAQQITSFRQRLQRVEPSEEGVSDDLRNPSGGV